MGGGLSPSPDPLPASPPKRLDEQFEDAFPGYLAIGMTYEQYWEGDPWLVQAYRKADEIRQRRHDTEAWLNGLYVYNALCCAAPLFHDLAKPGTKAVPYMEDPLIIAGEKRERTIKEQLATNAGRDYVFQFAERFNQRFKAKQQKGGEVSSE